MALAQETDILLLDEPTTFLDVAHQIEVLDLLTDLNVSRGTTIVMVLHDLNLAARYADELVADEGGPRARDRRSRRRRHRRAGARGLRPRQSTDHRGPVSRASRWSCPVGGIMSAETTPASHLRARPSRGRDVDRVSPNFARITFGGDDLVEFGTPGGVLRLSASS